MTYDYLIITNQPAFYKINLYNELNKNCKILVVYLGNGSKIRNIDFINKKMKFNHIFLFNDEYEKRNKLKSLVKMIKILTSSKYTSLLLGGWDEIEYWFLNLLKIKNKKYLVLESSYYESSYTGVKGSMKRLFLKKIKGVFASGDDQIQLLKNLKYQGKIIKTYGVGIFNKEKKIIKKKIKNDIKFLCIARLSEEKNLDLLVEVFNEINYSLTIIGTGLLENKLKSKSNKNIEFEGYISNKELYNWYSSHEIFILPSKSEPWGLVIDEALYCGLPVIVSNKVGCRTELVSKLETGLIFKYDDKEDLKIQIYELMNNYKKYFDNVKKLDFDIRDKSQINSYLKEVEL